MNEILCYITVSGSEVAERKSERGGGKETGRILTKGGGEGGN